MAVRFIRKIWVTVVDATGVGMTFEGHRIGFSVEHTKRSAPNPADIRIYGLSRSERNFVSSDAAHVILHAGYDQYSANLFVGDIRRVEIDRRPPEIITKIFAGDGERAYVDNRINLSLGPGSTLRAAINAAAAGLGLNMAALPYGVDLDVPFLGGITMSGRASRYLDELVSQIDGGHWSIQDGRLEFGRDLLPTLGEAIVITPDVVIGGVRPDVKTKKNRERIIGLIFKTFLDPTLRPNRGLVMKTEEYSGAYICESVRSTGDSGFETEYYSEVRCREPRVVLEEVESQTSGVVPGGQFRREA